MKLEIQERAAAQAEERALASVSQNSSQPPQLTLDIDNDAISIDDLLANAKNSLQANKREALIQQGS